MRSRAVLALATTLTLLGAVLALSTEPATASVADPPVLGAPAATADDLVEWFERRTVGSTATATVPVAVLASLYLEEGRIEGVRGDVAFVQAVLETGWFRIWGRVDPANNNFAGMGVFDGSSGHRFASARIGVRAHIQVLRGYATPGMQPDQLAQPFVAPRWMPPRYQGSARRWSQFGAGVWAEDPGYSAKILTLWSQVHVSGPTSGDTDPPAVPRPTTTTTRPAATAPAPTKNTSTVRPFEILVRRSASAGTPDLRATLGDRGQMVLPCDFDGDGVDTATLVRISTASWVLPRHGVPGEGHTFRYGRPGDIPVCGDWNGDGKDGIGIFRGGQFYLRHDAQGLPATTTVIAGRPGATPLIGDWDGDGRDDIGVRLGSQVAMLDRRGAVGWWFPFGRAEDIPVIGDWDGDGRDSIGIFRAGQWHISDELRSGAVDRTFTFGIAGDQPLTGHFGGDSTGVALQRQR